MFLVRMIHSKIFRRPSFRLAGGKKGLYLLGIFVLGFSRHNVAAQKIIDTQSHSWWMLFGNHRISEKFGIHTEYQWRRSDFAKNWQQSLLRFGLDIHLNDNAIVTPGYGWIVTFPYGDQPIAYEFNEHRIWHQLILKNKIGRFYFHHRYRWENRFLEQRVLNSSGDYEHSGYVFRQRFRYRFMASVPLNKKEMVKNAVFLAVYDEPFLGFGKGIKQNILDQNRLYAALGWQVSRACNVQLGYLNQMVVKSDGIKMERNHSMQLGITYNLDLRKQESDK